MPLTDDENAVVMSLVHEYLCRNPDAHSQKVKGYSQLRYSAHHGALSVVSVSAHRRPREGCFNIIGNLRSVTKFTPLSMTPPPPKKTKARSVHFPIMRVSAFTT